MKTKNRKTKMQEYEEKYKDIPRDYIERLNYLYEKENITEAKASEIIDKMNMMIQAMYFKHFKIILYEDPEGAPRPRSRLVNKSSIIAGARIDKSFIQVYSINGKEDRTYMKRLLDDDLIELEELIYTPSEVLFRSYHQIPGYFNKENKILAEIGIIRPLNKPDWDNIGKKYSDMYNGNIWIDDTCVIKGTVEKFYSILPRIEIDLSYLNMLYFKQQYKSMMKRASIEGIDKIYYYGSDKIEYGKTTE